VREKVKNKKKKKKKKKKIGGGYIEIIFLRSFFRGVEGGDLYESF
jgi:hypothetical protein